MCFSNNVANLWNMLDQLKADTSSINDLILGHKNETTEILDWSAQL